MNEHKISGSLNKIFGSTSADQPTLAAILMVSALMLLGLQDAIIKFTSSDVSLWQFQTIRSATNFVLLLFLARLIWGTSRPQPKNIWAVALRSVIQVATMMMFFSGMPFLSLAEIAAGLYVYPLFVAVLSIIILGERVGPLRLAAIFFGFTGTLLILKPGTESFSPVNLLPVGAAFCYACNVMTTRRLCREESPITLAYGVAITFFTAGLLGTLFLSSPSVADSLGAWRDGWPYLMTGWQEISITLVALILTCSGLNLAANIGLAKAYQSAESSWLAPIDYSYLIFATFWGFVFSRTIPDIYTFIGMGLIAGAGIFVAWRERQSTRKRTRRMPV